MKDLEKKISELNENEIKAINLIYKYTYTEIRAIRNEELAYELNTELDDLQSEMDRLINDNIVIKNGDRFSINNDVVKKLISMGILDIDGVISHLSIKFYETNLALNELKSEMSDIKYELNSIKETYDNLKKK